MDVNRRQLPGMAGALGGMAALGGCAGFNRPATETSNDVLTFTTWGTENELAGFERAIAGFEAANNGSTVQLNVVPYAEMFENIDAQLQSGNAPDIFRGIYTNLGVYAGREQLLDLSPYFDDSFGSKFTDQMWQAVKYGGTPYGVPHHTEAESASSRAPADYRRDKTRRIDVQ